MSLITRQFGPNPKGSTLTYQEMDNNLLLLDNTVKYIVSEDIPAGSAVSASLYNEGEVVRTKNEIDYTSLPNSSGINAHRCFKVSNNKSLYLGIDFSSGPTGLYAVVVENSGEIISYGTEEFVCPGFNTSDFDATLIDTDKILVAYYDISNQLLCFQVLTITGNSISSGLEYTISPIGGFNPEDCISITSPSTDEAVVAFGDAATGYFVGVSVSGTVCTIGTPAIFATNPVGWIKIDTLDSDRVIFSWQNDYNDPNVVLCKVYQISTDTFGSTLTAWNYSGCDNAHPHAIHVLDTDKVVIITKDETCGELAPLKFIVIDTTSDPLVITDTFDWGAKEYGSYYDTIAQNSSNYYYQIHQTVLLGTNRIAFIASPYIDLISSFSSYAFLKPILISVVDFSSGFASYKSIPIFVNPSAFGWAQYAGPNTGGIRICEVGNERINISFGYGDLNVFNGQVVDNVFQSSNLNSTFTTYLGMSITGASAGGEILVKSSGEITNTLSGLEPNTYYFVFPDGTFDQGDIYGYANSGGFRLLIGKAITTDRLQLLDFNGFE
jgi:hypothetical protein